MKYSQALLISVIGSAVLSVSALPTRDATGAGTSDVERPHKRPSVRLSESDSGAGTNNVERPHKRPSTRLSESDSAPVPHGQGQRREGRPNRPSEDVSTGPERPGRGSEGREKSRLSTRAPVTITTTRKSVNGHLVFDDTTVERRDLAGDDYDLFIREVEEELMARAYPPPTDVYTDDVSTTTTRKSANGKTTVDTSKVDKWSDDKTLYRNGKKITIDKSGVDKSNVDRTYVKGKPPVVTSSSTDTTTVDKKVTSARPNSNSLVARPKPATGATTNKAPVPAANHGAVGPRDFDDDDLFLRDVEDELMARGFHNSLYTRDVWDEILDARSYDDEMLETRDFYDIDELD